LAYFDRAQRRAHHHASLETKQKIQTAGIYTGFHRRQPEKNRQQTNKVEFAQEKVEAGLVPSTKESHLGKRQGISPIEHAAKQ
jgi:hypothetical protein